MSDEINLLPCPFCGAAPKLLENDHFFPFIFYFIFCEKCGSQTKECNESEDAISNWNRRERVIIEHRYITNKPENEVIND